MKELETYHVIESASMEEAKGEDPRMVFGGWRVYSPIILRHVRFMEDGTATLTLQSGEDISVNPSDFDIFISNSSMPRAEAGSLVWRGRRDGRQEGWVKRDKR